MLLVWSLLVLEWSVANTTCVEFTSEFVDCTIVSLLPLVVLVGNR